MPRSLCLFLSATIAFSPARADDKAKPVPVDSNAPVSFAKQVMPVLQRKCQGCHQPAKAQGKLDLTSFETLKKGGKTGPGFEAGKPDDSTLVDQVEGPKPIMPPTGPAMSPEEVDLVKRWVAQGAKDDTPPAAKDTIDGDHPGR